MVWAHAASAQRNKYSCKSTKGKLLRCLKTFFGSNQVLPLTLALAQYRQVKQWCGVSAKFDKRCDNFSRPERFKKCFFCLLSPYRKVDVSIARNFVMKKLSVIFYCLFISFSNLGHAHSPVGFVIPKDGSVIKQAPEKMEIVFTAPAKLIKLEFSRVIPNGKSSLIGGLLGSQELEAIDLDRSHLMKEAKRHVINIPMLDVGVYKTSWRALSEDGHAIKGEFAFEISAEGADASGAGAEFLEGEGKIKRVRGSKITIKHGALGDLMPAMTMEYDLERAGNEMDFKRGDTVVFKINKDLEIVSIQPK